MSILNVATGANLSPLVKPPVTREQLRHYADASGDHNPIHLDEDAAHRVGLQSVIAHGMLSMAFLGQFVRQSISGVAGAELTRLKVRYVGMVRLGDTLTCLGRVSDRRRDASGGEIVTLECWAQNQQGEKVTLGEATVVLPVSSTQKHEVEA